MKENELITRTIRRVMAVILTVLVIAGAMPIYNAVKADDTAAPAAQTVVFDAAQTTATITGTSGPLTVSGTGTLVLDGVTIDASAAGVSAIKLTSGAVVTIKISGTCLLTGGLNGAGIEVPETAALLLTADAASKASLTVIGNAGRDIDNTTSGSGIGSAAENRFGSIDIEGHDALTIALAAGFGHRAAGIGGTCGDQSITIRDTVIKQVTGGFSAAAYQAKVNDYYKANKEGGPAIGAAVVNSGDSVNYVHIKLDGVTIEKALGGSKAAAIGAGYWSGAVIAITDSKLSGIVGGATAAGIGGSRYNSSFARYAGVTVTIDASDVTAQGGAYGAAIGNGYNDNSLHGTASPATVLKITGDSTVTAIGGMGAAGLGGGYKGQNIQVVIGASAKVYAQAGAVNEKSLYCQNSAAAIGVGSNGSADFSQDGCTVAIAQGADVTAVAQGGKWAISCGDASATTAAVMQIRFLNDAIASETNVLTTFASLADNYYDFAALEDAVATSGTYRYDGQGTDIDLGGHAVTLPAGFYTAAATVTAGTHTVSGGRYTGTAVSQASYTTAAGYTSMSSDFTAAAGLTSFDHVACRPQPATYTVTYNYYTRTNNGAYALTGSVDGGSFQATVGQTVSATAAMTGAVSYDGRTYAFDASRSTASLTVAASGSRLVLNFYRTVTVTPTPTVRSYTLTVNYLYADGTAAASSYTRRLTAGSAYDVASPVITGYTADTATVAGSIGAADLTIDVHYAATVHTVTVNYRYSDGTVAAPSVTESYPEGAGFDIASPTIDKYVADQKAVAGTMTSADQTFTVVYKTEEIIDPTPTPLAGAAWALVNLICAIITVIIALMLVIGIIGKRREKQSDEQDGTDDEQSERRIKRHVWSRLASVVVGIVAVVVFILTEDMTLPMALVDRWTLLMVVILLVQVVVAILSRKTKSDDRRSQTAADQA